jgi:hypothetical protein
MTNQITIKTGPNASFQDLLDKVAKYSDVITLTTAFFRNEDGVWQTSITIETNNENI